MKIEISKSTEDKVKLAKHYIEGNITLILEKYRKILQDEMKELNNLSKVMSKIKTNSAKEEKWHQILQKLNVNKENKR